MPFNMDSRLVADIKMAEGCSLIAYKDSLGFFTIGYGHKLDQSIDWTGHEITPDTASSLLQQDIESAQDDATTLAEWPFLDTDCRQNAITELVFNMGIGTWRKFIQTRYCIQQSDWHGAYSNLLDSRWALQVGAKRSNRLAQYLLSGTYATNS